MATKTVTEPRTPKPRKVMKPKAKGTRGEVEFCKIMTELGMPTQRVVSSGSYKSVGAESDTKIGIIPNPDGTFPPADETVGICRGECKNLATTPEWLWGDLQNTPTEICFSKRPGNEVLWKHLNQSKSNRVLVLRRAKVPIGAIARKDYNEVQGVFLGVAEYARLLRLAYPDRVFHVPEALMEAV